MAKFGRIILITLLLGGCEARDYFADYEGVNLIEEYPFDPAAGAPNWVVDYGATTAGINYTDYMTASPATAGVEFPNTSGLPSGTTDTTRLEIHNLAENGDFEDGTTGWAGNPGPVDISTSAPEVLDGNTLYYDLAGGEDLTYNIETGITNAAAATAYEIGGRYLFRGDYRNWNTSFWEFSNAGNPYEIPLPFLPPAGTRGTLKESGINNEIIIGGAGETLKLYSGQSSQEGSLDNFRILRSDISPVYQLDLPQQSADLPELISGYYRFTCYYKIEEDNQITPTVTNSYRAGSLYLTIESLKNGSPLSRTPTAPLSLRGQGASTWKTYQAEGFLTIYEPVSSSEPVLRLKISPTDPTGDNDIGRLLIAHPILEYSATPWE